MTLFDSHCHLQDEAIFADFENVVARAERAGVKKMVSCMSSIADWAAISKLSEYRSIIPMFGIHPGFVKIDNSDDFEKLRQFLEKYPKAGVGETGLDFRKSFTNRAEQEESFAFHLDLARKLDRAIAVHCVHAWGRLIEIIQKHPAPRIILHAYSGSVELIPKLIELNCNFSFGGAVTNEKATRMRTSLANVPLENLLIETDAPYFPPRESSAPNEPCNLIYVAKAIAEIRCCSVEKIADSTSQNAISNF